MFLGHFGLAFAAKRAAPTVSLGTTILAAQWADLLWPTLVLLGIERLEIDPGNTAMTPLDFVHYPYSHSLVALVGWAVAFALAFRTFRRSALRPVLVVGGLVLSHWVLDVVTHRPDLPLTLTGPERLGLGLWNSVPATVAVEAVIFLGGLFLYARSTRAIDRRGRYALWGLVAFLALIQVANVTAPPPPSPRAVTWTAQAIWLLVAWGYWIDRHRRPVTPRWVSDAR
ncbi:MAG: hypothetical protein ABIP29_01020 [Candidatus Eisenbacteria bacterium]